MHILAITLLKIGIYEKNCVCFIAVSSAILYFSESRTNQIDNCSKEVAVKTKHETFSYNEGDTTYVMQKYFLVVLKKGPNRTHSQAEADALQKQHMAHISWLDKTGKISVAGPSEDHETVAGFLLFNTETFKEADSLARLDPAVKAGRLEVETMPWWATKGSVLK
ncbi:YciI family protein [Flavobacterium sp.]|jgi:uncharacterized protein YciI|uniref:YciI family protein n=1 Tax=Flavobacterium sp. TaxID=239 RepID=UPI0037C11502